MANLSKGNYLVNDGNTGQEIYYFCIKIVGSDLTSQQYSTANEGVWTIKILLTFIAIPRKKRINTKTFANKKVTSEAPFERRKQKNKTGEEKLIDALDLSEYLQIIDKLKDKFKFSREEIIRTIIEKVNKKYGINREELVGIINEEEINIPVSIFSKELGGLEAVVKYMKENLEMNYKEIADEINRDERTIWTSYKKSTEKQKEKIEEKETEIMIPLSIFKNSELTILESIIVYLKEKEMKFSEIAGLISRDERNVWTIYSRAKKKIK